MVVESKLVPPPARRGMVARTTLLDRLEASSVPVVAIRGPAGYGKTTLLAQWAARDGRPLAWVSIDEHDNDPAVLLTHLAAALDRDEPIDQAVFGALASPGASITRTVLPRLGAALAARAQPVLVALDDVHLLRNQDCLDAVAGLIDCLPERSQLAVTSRGEPPLPVARLRAEGRVVELGQAELAMDHGESGSLLRAAEVGLPDAEVAELVRRTEGWPVAVYLGALARRRVDAQGALAGREGLLAGYLQDYLDSVLLAGLPAGDVRFLTRTSVLDRMSGPLCDAVLDTSGSAEVLAALERSNLLVVPEGPGRTWYRYHRLFRELLRAALERREPDLLGELDRRAARWCEHHGLPEAAVEHAMRAGDADHAARLVTELGLPVYHGGGIATVQRWLGWFDEHGLVDRYPMVAVLGAAIHALVGRPAAAERWADAAERGSRDGAAPDGGAPLEGWLALLRAVLCRAGVARMRTDAELALTWVPMGSPWRATAHLMLGISYLLAGDPGTADGVLSDAVEVAEDAGATDTAMVALAERAILAIDREDWRDAELLVGRARSLLGSAHLDEYVTSVLVHAAAARVAAHQGDADRAQEELVLAQRLQPQVSHALSFYAVQAGLELARAYLALTDVAGARPALREVDAVLRRRPRLGVLADEAERLHKQVDHLRAEVVGVSTLTAAELRLLPLLPTHRSFREIGDRLCISPHTVKSQAMSIYRKLGVSSRSEAIERALTVGLLTP